MGRKIVAGIDVGTYATRVVVAERTDNAYGLRVIGAGVAESKGMRHGYVINREEVAKSIRRATREAERISRTKIKKAILSIGGVTLESSAVTGTVITSRADGEVTDMDVQKAISEAEEKAQTVNRKIIDIIPLDFTIDGKKILGRPSGMHGSKLEAKVLAVSTLSQHFDDLVTAATEADLDVEGVIPAPIAASNITLTEKQKVAGCALLDIGAETVSLAVFENGNLISLEVFAIGGSEITNDIALVLKISLEEAEGIKTGSLVGDYSKKKLDEIIEARLSDVLELVDKHLKKIKRSGLLPAGIIISGGGSHIQVLEELAKKNLNIPAKIAQAEIFKRSRSELHDPSWMVALGLCITETKTNDLDFRTGSLGGMVKSVQSFFKSLVKQLSP